MNHSITEVSKFALVLALLTAGACHAKQASDDRTEAKLALPPVPAGAQRVLATADGFQPSRLDLKRGTTLLFRRTTNDTCATAVVFPDMKIEKDLPLNTDVAIRLPDSARGELVFQCGMGMYRSKVVVID
jgi:hypothetical protein